ncbi:aminotransferase class IV [Streptomyces sp. NPDC004327]|uniref:aminotransferase class IV n=1 Tax=unclassified Streptomyces TaxID=2593676 RepID=UPI00369706E5
MTTPPAAPGAPQPLYVEIDGAPAAAEPGLLASLLSGYGHYTAMQVRDGRVQGLGLHLERLDGSTRELFGQGLNGGRVRALLAGALAGSGRRDASARVYVYEGAGSDGAAGGGPRTVVTVRAPFAPERSPKALKSVRYWRPAAHIKHLGGFGQRYHGDAARRAGFDEALLTDGPSREIAEGAVTNIAFWDGTSAIWPAAPHLAGTTMALVAPRLPSVTRPVHLAEVPYFRAAFVTSARGIAPVTRIDDTPLRVDEELMARVHAAHEAAPWDAL